MRYRHYNPIEGTNKKGYYRCLGHTGYCPVCVAASNGFGGEGKYKLKKAQEMFGANVLVYTTDDQGNPIQPLNAEVYFWSFNARKFVDLRSIQEAWGSTFGDITQIDLQLTCADAQAAQFQNVTIMNLPNCLYNSDPVFKAQCDAKIEKDKYPLARMLCKEVSVQEMVAAFGLPQNYLPQDMLAQMPQEQQTVTDYANGVTPQPVQSQQVQPQVAPQMAPVQQVVPQAQPQMQPQVAPVQAQPQQTFPQGGLNYGAQASTVAPVQQEAPQAQPSQVAPVPQEAPQAQPTQVAEDAYADLNSLQSLLG